MENLLRQKSLPSLWELEEQLRNMNTREKIAERVESGEEIYKDD